jgi:hypothetical protein
VGDFSMPLSSIGRSPHTQKIRDKLHHRWNGLNSYSIFHQTAVEYTFFSAAHKTFSKIHHILGYKANL